MTDNLDPKRRSLVKILSTTPLLPLTGGGAAAALLSACGGGNDTASAAPQLKSMAAARVFTSSALPTPTLGLGYDTLSGYTFDAVAGAQHNLLTTGQLQGAGMIQLVGNGVETASPDTDTVGTKSTVWVQGTLPGTDPSAYGVLTLLVKIDATARGVSFQQIQVALSRGNGHTGSANFNVALRPGRHTLALDIASQCPLVLTGSGPTTVKVGLSGNSPYAANASIDALLVNCKGQPTWVVTGDDGYKTHRDFLWPILKQYNIPLTLYIPTRQVGTGSGISARLSWEDLKKFKGDSGSALAYGTNTTLDKSITSFATPALAVADLQTSWADFTANTLDSPAMYHMALSNGDSSESYLAALDAAGMKTYRSVIPPTNDVANFTRFGIYQNKVMSRGFSTKADGTPGIPLATTMAAMDHNDAIGGTMFVHFHQTGENYAECGPIGCTRDYVQAVADRIKASVDAGGVALTVDQWYARDSVQLFPVV
jgi:hypothetical protein